MLIWSSGLSYMVAGPGADRIFVDACQSNVYKINSDNYYKVSFIKNFDSNQDKIVLFCCNRGINSTDIKSCYFNDNQVNFLIVNDVDDREVCGSVKAWPVLAKIPHSK
ncbi:MAG: hypothetical protein MRQ13_01075 [Candidatus Midichloria sp.]|nr:hypothetical protein [Candidatus Midichloria sp.]